MPDKTNIDIEYENYSKVMFAWGLLSSLDFSNDEKLGLEQLMIGEAELANTIKKVDTLCDKFNKRLWLICRKEGDKTDNQDGVTDYHKKQLITWFDLSRSKFYLDVFMDKIGKGNEPTRSLFQEFEELKGDMIA